MKRNVFFDGETLPDDGDTYVEVPKGNDRMWKLTLFNRRRGADREKHGTLTMWRLRAIIDAINKRYPEAVKHPAGQRPKKIDQPLIIRSRRAGPIIAKIEALEGPVASMASKQ